MFIEVGEEWLNISQAHSIYLDEGSGVAYIAIVWRLGEDGTSENASHERFKLHPGQLEKIERQLEHARNPFERI